jgi:simple sugar transport system permease protein
MLYISPVLAVAISALLAAALFAMLGHDPLQALAILFLSPFGSTYGLAELALKATPLLLCAIGIAIAVRANVWNIGAEGQFTLGAISGGWVALAYGDDGGGWVLPAMLLAGIAGGMVWAAIPAYLKIRFNAHEILTTLMMSYVAIQLLSWLVHGPWQDPEGFNFPQTRQFAPAATLTPLIEGTRITIATPIAVAVVPVAAFLLRRTLAGFSIRLAGLAPAAAAYAGFDAARTVWFVLLVSGGLAGLAGIAEVAGPIGQLLPLISPGYGFAAIIVAFLGRLNPYGIVVSSVLMALLYLGGESLQMKLELPLAVPGVVQGMLLFSLLAADVLILYRLRWRSVRLRIAERV